MTSLQQALLMVSGQAVCIDDPTHGSGTVLKLHGDEASRERFYATSEAILHMENLTDNSAAARTYSLVSTAAITATRALFGLKSWENTVLGNTASMQSAATFNYGATEPLCIEFSVYLTSYSSGSGVCICIGTGGSNRVGIGFTSAGLPVFYRDAGLPTTGGSALSLNTWHRIGIQFHYTSPASQQMTFYVDGGAAFTASGVVGVSAMTNAIIVVGCDPFGYTNTTVLGSIDEVSVNRADKLPIASSYAPLPFPLANRALATAVDSSGTGKTVTYAEDATTCELPIAGKFGRAFFIPRVAPVASLNGLDITDHADFDFGTSDYTIEMWGLRFGWTQTGKLFYYQTAGGFMAFSSQVTDGKIFAEYSSSGGNQGSGVLANVFTIGVWHHIAMQRRGNNYECYFDGVLVDTRAITGGGASVVNSSGNLYIGRANSAGSVNWDGLIDEIVIRKGYATYTGAFTPYNFPWCDH